MTPDENPGVTDVRERYVDRDEKMIVAFAARYLAISRGTLSAFAFMWWPDDGVETPPEEVPGFSQVYLWRQHQGTPLTLTLSRANLLHAYEPFLLERYEEEDPGEWKVTDADGDVWEG